MTSCQGVPLNLSLNLNKGVPWAKSDSEKPVVGVDLGGTKVLAGVVAPNGKILATVKRATKPEGGPAAVVERVRRACARR